MEKTEKVVLVSHCILNFYSKVEGINKTNDLLPNLTKYLIDKNYGIIQLPCPEITLYGLRRWGHVKEQFNTPYYRNHCKIIFQPILEQIQDYINNGYKVKALICINGSPSCGLDFTCSSSICRGTFRDKTSLVEKTNDIHLINESGVFIEEIQRILKEQNIKIKFIAVDENNEELSMKLIKEI